VSEDKPAFTCGTIRVFDEGLYWEFNGRRRRSEDFGAQAHVNDLVEVPARDLKAALRRFETVLFENLTLRIVTAGSAEDDLEFIPLSEVSFELADGELVMELEHFDDDIPEDEQPRSEVQGRIAPLLARKGLWLVDVTEDLDDAGRYWHVLIRIGFNVRGRTGAQLVADGLEIVELIRASAGGLTPATVADLLRAGHATALLGQPEGSWLEAKREHYPLKEMKGKIRIAQTVAQFANADSGGVVVIGLATKQVAGVDTINAVTPIEPDPNVRRRYVQVLQNHLYPPPGDLSIEVVRADGGDLLLIVVPPQPEELKPFLVHGAIVDGHIQGSFISIVRRRDDEAISTTAPAIHATLAAGRALLRRGRLPEDPPTS
jgi:hypothetical protein